MKRLLWKELREKWIWLAALIVAASVPILLGDAYMFIGESYVDTAWVLLSAFVALCMGASTYSSELAGGAADFIRSRPVSWKRLLLAKLIVGVLFVLKAVFLAALVLRLVCPAEYLRFASPLHLLVSSVRPIIVMGLAYLCGVLVSVVLPGVVGSLFVMIGLIMVAAMEIAIYDNLGIKIAVFWSLYLGVVGTAVAVVLISRFGTTLPASVRLIRYMLIVGIFMLIGLPLQCMKFDPFLLPHTEHFWRLSSDGKFAALEQTRFRFGNPRGSHSSYFVRVSDGKKARTHWPYPNSYACWAGDTFAVTSGRVAPTRSGSLWIGRMDASGRLRHATVPLQAQAYLAPSPDDKYIMVFDSLRMNFVDAPNLLVLRQSIEAHVFIDDNYWWQSNNTVGYTSHGRRQFVSLTE